MNNEAINKGPETARSYLDFVGREAELDVAWDRLNNLRKGVAVPYPVVLFYGPPKIGRTTLLIKFQDLAVSNLIPTAYINLGDAVEKTRILQQIMDQWELTAQKDPFEHLLIERKEGLEEMTRKTLAYAQWLGTGAYPRPTALLLDNPERASSENFEWLQENVLEPLLNSSKIFIALALIHDVPLEWSISRRTQKMLIRPFSPVESEEHIGTLTDKPIPQNHQPLVELGIPGLNKIIAGSPHATQKEIVEQVVENIFAGSPGCSPDIQRLLLAMSNYPKFDLLRLAVEAVSLFTERYTEATRKLGATLVKGLTTTGLIENSPDGSGWRVVPPFDSLFKAIYTRNFDFGESQITEKAQPRKNPLESGPTDYMVARGYNDGSSPTYSSPIGLITNQIEEARLVQLEREEKLDDLRKYSGGKYQKLLKMCENIDSAKKANLAQALSWTISTQIALAQLSGATDSEISTILGYTPSDVERQMEELSNRYKSSIYYHGFGGS